MRKGRRSVALGLSAVSLMAITTGVAKAAPIAFDSQVAVSDGKGEPQIAVDALDPQTLVDAYTSGVAVSHDGGHTWRQVLATSGGDPVVMSDANGNFFASELGSYTFVESTDRGETWHTVGGPLHNRRHWAPRFKT